MARGIRCGKTEEDGDTIDQALEEGAEPWGLEATFQVETSLLLRHGIQGPQWGAKDLRI